MADTEMLKEQLDLFFQSYDFTLSPLPGGASSRNYYKLHFHERPYFPSRDILLMVTPRDEIEMLTDYMNIDYYLKRMNIPTPRLFEINQDQGWIFLEYKDSPTLEDYLRTAPQAKKQVLPDVIDFLLDMQKKCIPEEQCPAFRRRFDYAKYEFEFDFHVKEQLLRFYFKHDYNTDTFQKFVREVCSALDIAEAIFVHRDFQSSNILFDAGDTASSLNIIDFQDARHGSPVYDLVSCLWDSYVDIDPALRARLLKRYYDRLPELGIKWDVDYFHRVVDYTVIQRKLHDAGAFAYNYRRFKSKRYVNYITGAIEMAIEAMRKHPGFSKITREFESL